MHNIIKDGAVVQDNWIMWREEALPTQDGVIVPLAMWLANKAQLQTLGRVAVFLCNESPKELAADIADLALIAVDFPKFTDGRGFTYGRELREQHGFTGELRATGDIMRDQLFYLSRCGFNSFALENEDLNDALNSLSDFTEAYQASIERPQPLFRRAALKAAG